MVLALRDLSEDLLRRQHVQAFDVFFRITNHRISFATSCLAVGETSHLGSLERGVDERFNGCIIDLRLAFCYEIVVALFAERLIELEIVLFDIFGKIDLFSGGMQRLLHFAHNQSSLRTHFTNVRIAGGNLLPAQGTLPNCNLNFRYFPFHLNITKSTSANLY